MPVTYPGGGPTITVEALLNQPRLIARALTSLTNKRYVADDLLQRGTPDQVRGGAALYQRSENIFTNDNPSEVMPRSEYPRTSWSEAVLAAAVHKHGLEFPVSDEQRRRNAMDVVARGQRKIANSVVKYVDTLAMTLITSDTGVQTGAASGDWTTAATDIISDIAKAKAAIANLEEGYEADMMIVNPAQELDLINDVDIRNVLPREGNPQNAVLTGQPVPLLGLRSVRTTAQLAAGKVIVANSKIIGTIADEAPDPVENYQTYNPGGAFAPMYTKVYRNDNVDESIVRGARFPAMWLAEPAAAYILTAA